MSKIKDGTARGKMDRQGRPGMEVVFDSVNAVSSRKKSLELTLRGHLGYPVGACDQRRCQRLLTAERLADEKESTVDRPVSSRTPASSSGTAGTGVKRKELRPFRL